MLFDSDGKPSGIEARRGTVYLVGAGPGDVGLITERGAALLASADVVMNDELVAPALLERVRPDAIVIGVGKRGHDPIEKRTKQGDIDAALVAHAKAGKSVVRLKGGDPFLFGRGSEEITALVEADVPFEVVPGVSSPFGAAAYAGIPLTHRELASSVTFVAATTIGGALFDFAELKGLRGTIVVLMGARRIEDVARALVDDAGRAPTTDTAIVENGTLPGQRVVEGTLADIAARALERGVKAPAIIVVGDVVRLREKLRWFDARPLFGKRVLVMRARHQAGSVDAFLRSRGAEPIVVPTIAIATRRGDAEATRVVDALDGFDAVAFTSENAVAAFFEVLRERGRDARAFGKARVASVGAATTAALRARGSKRRSFRAGATRERWQMRSSRRSRMWITLVGRRFCFLARQRVATRSRRDYERPGSRWTSSLFTTRFRRARPRPVRSSRAFERGRWTPCSRRLRARLSSLRRRWGKRGTRRSRGR